MSILSKLAHHWQQAQSRESLIVDAVGGAQWAADALTSSGYRADFSVESLRDLDRFFDEHAIGGQVRPGGLLGRHLGQRLFCLGAYCGEVVRRAEGGAWITNGLGPQAEIDLALELPDGTFLWPVRRVMNRFQLGPEQSLYAYARSIAAI